MPFSQSSLLVSMSLPLFGLLETYEPWFCYGSFVRGSPHLDPSPKSCREGVTQSEWSVSRETKRPGI